MFSQFSLLLVHKNHLTCCESEHCSVQSALFSQMTIFLISYLIWSIVYIINSFLRNNSLESKVLEHLYIHLLPVQMDALISHSSKSYYACVGESTIAYQSPSKDLTAINNRLNGYAFLHTFTFWNLLFTHFVLFHLSIKVFM